MKPKSHHLLGQYLVREYLNHLPRAHTKAFLLGCVEPDKNPATYLKGSLRCQWLRGHNYANARRFMTRLAERLEKKETLTVLDCYALGKLIHYTADAFTAAHNTDFPADLNFHRSYEAKLQAYFIPFLLKKPQCSCLISDSIMESIRDAHRQYRKEAQSIHTDCKWTFRVCCSIASYFTCSVV